MLKKIHVLAFFIIMMICFCHCESTPRAVMDKFVIAFNNQDSLLLKQVVADTAKYMGQSRLHQDRLWERIKLSWTYPVTKDCKMTIGTRDDKEGAVIWCRPLLADSTLGQWTKMLFMNLEIRGGKITRAVGDLTISDVKLQERIVASPPK